ncbi:hypothetical protein Tco_1235791 [Tanacetum coccineum]
MGKSYTFIHQREKNGRMMLDSINNGLLVYPTVEENKQTRPKKYFELTEVQQLQDDCDVQATNIILHDLPPDVYALVNHQEAAKDIWGRVKLLMKGTELSYQERECRLYNLFDKFAYVQGETLYEYYWRFSQLINDMHTIGMTMQQVQINTKFLNALPPKWSKFVTDVKLAKSLYTTNYDQLYAYLSQHERHANEVLQSDFLQLDSGLAVPTFQQGDDPIECINKAMAFLFIVASRFPPSNRHMAKQCTQSKRLRSSTWFKEKLMFVEAQEAGQILDEEQLAFIADPGIAKVQVAQQTIPQNSTFQTEDLDAYDSDCDDISSAKAVLMENLQAVILMMCKSYSEQIRIDDYPDNEIHSGSNIISYFQYLQESQNTGIQDTNSSAPNDLLVLSLVEQMTDHVANLDKENQTNKMVNESLTVELERYKERVAIFGQRLNVDLNKREKLIDSQMDDLIQNRNPKLAAFQQEIDTIKETLSTHVKEKESLAKTLNVFKPKSKEKSGNCFGKQNKELENIICKMYRSTQAMHMLTKPQVFYDDTHKQGLGYQNPFNLKKAQRIKPTLYNGSVIVNEHVVISVIDDEGTLILEEESRSKMIDKQNDLISLK